MAIATRDTSGIKTYYGLASDTKPTSDVPTGSRFYVTDTSAVYIYSGSAWSEAFAGPALMYLRGGGL